MALQRPFPIMLSISNNKRAMKYKTWYKLERTRRVRTTPAKCWVFSNNFNRCPGGWVASVGGGGVHPRNEISFEPESR